MIVCAAETKVTDVLLDHPLDAVESQCLIRPGHLARATRRREADVGVIPARHGQTPRQRNQINPPAAASFKYNTPKQDPPASFSLESKSEFVRKVGTT